MKTSFNVIPIMRDTLKNTALNMCFGLASLCSLVHFTPISTQQNQASKRAITTTLLFCLLLCVVQAQPWLQLPLTGSTATSSLIGIHFVDDQIGYVVGTNGLISKTIDGGLNWTPQTSGTNNTLYSTYFIDANTGFAVGDNAVVRRTSDGGASWQTSTIPASVAGHSFRGVWFYNAYEGYIVGGVSTSLGTILKTTNGGLTWVDISPNQVSGPGGKAFYDVFFTDATTGYACDFDGRILKTADGGISWTSPTNYPTGLYDHLSGIHFLTPTTTNPIRGYAVGSNDINPNAPTSVLLKTLDGTNWTSVPIVGSNFLSDIKFFGNTGFIVGGNVANNTGVIYKTTDSGITWTLESTIPLSANSVKRLQRVSLPSSNTGYADGLNGTILKIDDINEKICCDSFNNTFINANFTYTNAGNVYTFTKPAGTIGTDILTWTFGDGQTGTGSPVTHTYPSVSNSYLATLTIIRPQVGGDTCRVKLSRLINTQPCPNLVVNGDFSLGNTGFTSNLLPGCTVSTDCATGYYCVSNNFTNKCSIWPATFDHTFSTAAGSFMSIDGNTTVIGPVNIWKQINIPVNINTTYKFSFWAKSVYTSAQQVLNVDMSINGTAFKPVPNTLSTSIWKEYTMIWNSGTSTTADLAIRQLQLASFSDFGIDDISFTCVSCEDFMTDVMNYGIQSTLVSGNTYKYCVSPNVSSTDIVQWDLDCNGTIDATTNTPCQNFTLTSANSQICATVLHVIKPGDTCRVKVNTCLPRTVPTQACVCDSTFTNSVNAGFTWSKTTPYAVTFTPNSLLNNCDSVRWALGNNTTIGNSAGNGSITYTFPSTPGTYTVCMFVVRTTPTGSCKRETCVSITLSGSLRASDIELPNVIVRPNPTMNAMSISVPPTLNNHKNSVRITSLEGRTMSTTTIESVEMTLKLETLPAGMYFLSLYNEKGNMLTRPTKFVKQ